MADLPARHLQTDMTAGSGNALQACVASMLGKPMDDVPNFVTMPSYEEGIREFCGGATKIVLPPGPVERWTRLINPWPKSPPPTAVPVAPPSQGWRQRDACDNLNFVSQLPGSM